MIMKQPNPEPEAYPNMNPNPEASCASRSFAVSSADDFKAVSSFAARSAAAAVVGTWYKARAAQSG